MIGKVKKKEGGFRLKDWVTEIKDRMKGADNACTVLELCEHELRNSIREDIETIEYTDEPPVGLKVKQELLAELEGVIRVCNEYGEYSQMKFEQEMEKGICRAETVK